MALDELRKLLEEATGRVGEFVDEYEQTPSPSAGALRSTFNLSSAENKNASPEMDAFLARMNAVRDRRDAEVASRLPPVKAREDMPREGVPLALRPSNWVTARPASLGLSQSKTSSGPVGSLGVVPVPPPESNHAPLLGPFYKEVDESTLPPMGIRLPVEAGPMMNVPSAPSAPVISRDTVLAEKTPEAQPIPVANAPSTSDAVAPVTSAIAATGPQTPADKPESMGTPGLPAPSSEGAGGDALGRLSLGQALTRALEGSGSVIAGRDLRSGAADTLGERMKQIEALRAKREERSADVAQEQAQYEGANLATLTTQLAAFKDRPDIVAALQNLKPGAKYTKPSDFIKSAYQAVTNPPTVAAKEATTGKTLVQIPDIQAGTAGKVAKAAEIGPEGESKRKLRAAQVAKIYKDMELAGTKLALDERKTIEQAQQSKDPFKKLESLNTIADKKEFGGFTTLAGDLGDLERVAPGFVTRGEVPEWLTREQQALGQNWPTSTDPRVVDFLAAYGKVANEERHRQYGSAQTDGELRAFMQQLNSSPLSAGPQVLAQQVKRFGQAAGRVAKGRLTRYNNVFGAENVDTVLGPEWKELFDTGGVFAGQGTPFVATRAPAAAGGAPETATVTIKRKTDGKTKTVPAADRAKWLANPEFEEVK